MSVRAIAFTGRPAAIRTARLPSCCMVVPDRDARHGIGGCSIRLPSRCAVRPAQLGRSTRHASAPDTNLASNHTANLIADIEAVARASANRAMVDARRIVGQHAGVGLCGTLSECVTEIVLFGVTTGRRKEFDWLFRGGVADLESDACAMQSARAARHRYHRGILRTARRSRRVDSRTRRAGVVYVGVRDACVAACARDITKVQRSRLGWRSHA